MARTNKAPREKANGKVSTGIILLRADVDALDELSREDIRTRSDEIAYLVRAEVRRRAALDAEPTDGE